MASERLQVILELVTGRYKAAAAQAAVATQAIGTSARTTTAATVGMGQKMRGLAGSGGGLLALAGGAFVAKKAFDGTVGAFANFDDAMTQSLAIMGDVSEMQRGEMSDAAREVAKTTTFSAEQAAESYFFLASAGLDAEQSIAALPQVAAFAQAGMFDMALATDLATDAQSALGLTIDDAAQNLTNMTRVTDVFTKANNLANTSVQQVAEAMTNKAGAALRALGKDIEEGAAVLAAFADQGVKGAEAGTQFAIVLRDLQTKALQNKEAFKEAGVAVFDASGEMRNIADIIGDLEGALAGLSDAESKTLLLGLGFSDKSVAAITNLLGTSNAIREYEAALRDAGGTTKEVADKQLESAKAQWALFLSGLQDVGIEIGEKMVPALINLLPVLEDSVGGIASVVEILGPLLEMLGLVTGAYTDLRASAEHMKTADDPFSRFAGGLTELMSGGALPGAIRLTDQFFAGFGDNTSIDDTVEAYGSLTDKLADGQPVLEGTGNLVADLGDSAATAGSDIEGMGDDAEETIPTIEELAAAVRDATRAYLESANPIFAAQSAMDRYKSAQEKLAKVQKDGKSTAEDMAAAQLDVASAALDAEAALQNLGDSDLQQGIHAIANALGISSDEARELLQQLNLLDGKRVTTVVNTRFVSSGGGRPPGGGVLRQHGGPVRAGSLYQVGEGDRPELMLIPGDNGRVFSNSDSRALIAALSGAHGSQWNITLEGTGVPQVDAQRVGAMASVLRRMESN